MTDAVAIALISAVASVAAAGIGLANNILGRENARHIAEAKDSISQTKTAIITLEKQTNSIKDALVKVTGESEYAKGLKDGTDASVSKD